MSTVQKFYAAKKAADALIDPGKSVVHIASRAESEVIAHTPVILPVSRDTASRMLAKGTHRLATAEEAAKYDDQEKKNQHAAESKRELPMTAETIAHIASAVNKTSAPSAAPVKGKGDN